MAERKTEQIDDCAKKNYRHMDYLREVPAPAGAWCSYAPVRLGHVWAHALGRLDKADIARGLGEAGEQPAAVESEP